ncbi:beta-1,6-N-acetylglucosaminyltransferase [Neolewinella antarctica]|uniref:Peptide O-xylosyltransferase n=1 Tax=Neolewinella antarctica TaxID=442734 RepID=A0ABX0X8R8_9BACT|nr:beta-1,6-N-acetylglucosaminyltransferase [Neolewinella antarctica]NJC25651.1 hypothetical protein [Neolewinella antarctica]
MKHAALITAYKDFEQLKVLINELGDGFNVYVHVDKKSVVPAATIHEVRQLPNVAYVGQDYKVNWGAVNHLKSYIKLARTALTNADNQYFHLITGQDYPVQSSRHFASLMEGDDRSYLEHFSLPSPRWSGGGLERLEYYNLCSLIDAKQHGKWVNRIIRLQKLVKFKRPISEDLGQLYGGSTYWSLSREILRYVIDFTDRNPSILDRFKHTFCAEEIYFQTVVMNSPFAHKVVNDSRRFIDWAKAEEGSPPFLDESDYSAIVSSDCLFARKIDGRETELIEKLTAHRKETQDVSAG